MLKMTGLEEVVSRRQLLACPDVPAARAAGGRVPEAVDGKHTRPDISCYADHLAGQNWRSRDPESPGHIAATAEIDLHHVRRLRAAARSWRRPRVCRFGACSVHAGGVSWNVVIGPPLTAPQLGR